MQLTDEQSHAVDMAMTNESMALEALAGTGKTTTLKVIADQKPNQTGLYVAFNKAIAKEAESKFPRNVECRTLHSLAHEAVRKEHGWFIDRMSSSERLKFGQIARHLGLTALIVPHWSGIGTRRLNPGRLAGYTMAMVRKFCTTADEEISAKHMPRVDGLDKPDEWTVHNMIGAHLEDFAQDAWRDISTYGGVLQFDHGCYLKMFQLMKPTLSADFLLIDEAQDLNPLMSAILTEQPKSQIIAVGDARQQIYEWNGAVNALASFEGNRAWLTKSFRFGPAIADAANWILENMLEEEVRVEGLGGPSSLGPIERPDAILSRRNSTTIRRASFEMKQGRKVHIEGGGKDIQRFAFACMDLKNDRFVSHPDLACFVDWSEVMDYIEEDELGGELESMIRLVVELGESAIIDTVKNTSSARNADLTVTTAHKSKGLEWPRVTLTKDMVGMSVLDEDYEPDKMSLEDKRLLYVAVTRAEGDLDLTAIPPMAALR